MTKTQITKEQLIECLAGLKPRDFSGFAARVTKLDAALGKTVELHADAADGNSPDLPEWIDGTMLDAAAIEKWGWNTPEAAACYWKLLYSDIPWDPEATR